jgi:polysaccharide biosynthesis protein PslH
MKILYLVPHVPNPTKVRSYYQIRGLFEAGHSVTIATVVRSASDAKHIQHLEQMGYRVLAAPVNRPVALINALSAFTARRPMQSSLLWSNQLMQLIETNLRENPPDLIHIEHLRMACYGLPLSPHWPIVWDAVDHLASLYQQAASTSKSLLWQAVGRIEAPLLGRYETSLTGKFPATLVISKYDQNLFRQENPNAERIHVASLGIPLPPHEERVRAANRLILTGTLNYHPNITSAHYFVEHILPLIHREHPDIELQLVGANPVPSIQKLSSPRVHVTGFVPVIEDYLREAAIALAPIQYGSGTQVKVIEAFASATPVVATSKALRGLDVRDNEHVLIADTPVDFASAVLRLLADPMLRAEIGQNGRRYVEEHHDIQQTTAHLTNLYRQIMDEVPRK